MKTYFYRRFDFSKSIWNWIFFAFVDFIPFFVFPFGQRSYKIPKYYVLFLSCKAKRAWKNKQTEHKVKKIMQLKYSIVKDSNADLTVGNWESKIDPLTGTVLV